MAIEVGLKGENPKGLNCFRSRPARERTQTDPRSLAQLEGWQMLRIAIVLMALLWATMAHADDEEMIATGKAAVAAKLIDPDSARFTDVRVTTKNGRQFVCGLVDARNQKGGYDGAKPFVYITKEKSTRHSAIIYGGRSITNDRFSALAQPAAFSDVCGG